MTGISLKKAFENVKNAAKVATKAQSDFSKAIGDSKYQDIEIPDPIVDVTDYGQGDMTYEEFKKLMDAELQKHKELNKIK